MKSALQFFTFFVDPLDLQNSKMVKFSRLYHFVCTWYTANYKCRNSYHRAFIDNKVDIDRQVGR